MTNAHGRPDRAVIDIGSNTVRLVAYAGSPRAPRAWLNESVHARLGRELASTRLMPEKAMEQALSALRRYAVTVADLGIADVQTVATAAARDADNGPAFLARVADCGLTPRLLSGEEEARGSAFGVISAFPGARGCVADLGGGSLELVAVEDGDCHHGVSLPLGTLRLSALRNRGPSRLADAVRDGRRSTGWDADRTAQLYLVGGTWRAFAAYAIHTGSHPLSDAHGFTLGADEAQRIAKDISGKAPAELELIPGISATRASSLPDAAVLMRALLGAIEPASLVFSSWGLREGLLFQRLPAEIQRQDPLLAAVADFAEPRGGASDLARLIVEWGGLSIDQEQPAKACERRLRLVAAQLALAAAQVEPSLRARKAYEWALDKRWVGLTPAERGWLAAALQTTTSKSEPRSKLVQLADHGSVDRAIGWGLTIRLAKRLAAGSGATLRHCRLDRQGGRLVLALDPSRSDFGWSKVVSDLGRLAKWYALEPKIQLDH